MVWVGVLWVPCKHLDTPDATPAVPPSGVQFCGLDGGPVACPATPATGGSDGPGMLLKFSSGVDWVWWAVNGAI